MQVHSRKQNKTKQQTYILPLQYLHQAEEDHFLDRVLIYLSREYLEDNAYATIRSVHLTCLSA